jgi:hypothetical protein
MHRNRQRRRFQKRTRQGNGRGAVCRTRAVKSASAIERALAQEDGRYRLRDLKRAHAREAKRYVNCPLDYDTKMRLQKAAFDNDIKMTVIIKAAIDQFLRDNGY